MGYVHEETIAANKSKPIHLQDVITLRAASLSDDNKDVREQLITRTWESMSDIEKAAVDRFMSMLCDTSMFNMQAEAEANSVDMGEKIVGNMRDMDAGQKFEYIKISDHLDVFLVEMKSRFAQKIKHGRKGFDGAEIVKPVEEEIRDRLPRLRDEMLIGVGLANWCFIDWYRKNCM
jgi:hypothetical protein